VIYPNHKEDATTFRLADDVVIRCAVPHLDDLVAFGVAEGFIDLMTAKVSFGMVLLNMVAIPFVP
jgi:hypothetical protein